MITILGTTGLQGVYLLRVEVIAPLAIAFGRFAGGRTFMLPAGEYLYIGSAMGQRGAATLAARLLRHATRSGDRPPQAIREPLFDALQLGALCPRLPTQKHCHWHIDYLLDQSAVALTAVYARRTMIALEAVLARRLMAEQETTVVVPGLGASDDRGATHLLQVAASSAWWEALPSLLINLHSMI